MKQYEHLQTQRDARDVITVTFDLADRPVNVFNEQLFGELSDVIEGLENDRKARLILFRSGKESGFIAGADVHRIQQISTEEEANTAIQAGQELFQRVADLSLPTVAAIHGNCLGGGLEFALACKYRIAKDDGSTKLGLPETQLGLIPGWGGTQRLPRRVGLQRAIKMILAGSPLPAAKAKEAGLVDALAAPDAFDEEVSAFVDRVLAGRAPEREKPSWIARLRDETALGRMVVFKLAHKQVARQSKHYPALPAALRAMETGLKEGLPSGLVKEREEFCRVLFTPTSRNLQELFFQRERARSPKTWTNQPADGGDVSSIQTVAVLGAGTMGAGIAQLAATQNLQVVLKDIDETAVRRGMQEIESLTHKGVKKGALDSQTAEKVLAAITPTTEMEPVTRSDLVIEAIVERLNVKQQVFRELDEHLPAESWIASNTSALPIGELAAVTNRADRIAGLHFFNPVHKMPLVEVVRAEKTSDSTVAALVKLVRSLGKTPIVVADGPGFLVNRILFPYFDEAVRLVVEGRSVSDIDREAKRFGMPMGPLELLDTVGIDVAADVSGHLPLAGAEQSPTPNYLTEMVSAGRLGQKSEAGFYQYKQKRRRSPLPMLGTPDENSRLPIPKEFAGETVSGIQQRLIFSLIKASADALDAGIVSEPWMVDLGMVLGTGFAPFRGGPLRLAETWGFDTVTQTLDELSSRCGPRFHPSSYFSQSPTTSRSDASQNPIRV